MLAHFCFFLGNSEHIFQKHLETLLRQIKLQLTKTRKTRFITRHTGQKVIFCTIDQFISTLLETLRINLES